MAISHHNVKRNLKNKMSSFVGLVIKRAISTTAVLNGKRNFKKFPLYNKRGTRQFKELRKDPAFGMPIDKRGVRDTGYVDENGKYVEIPEKVPELLVPDLTGFNLKPYVSYRAPDVIQGEFTAQDLFNVVYAAKIKKDFIEGKLNPDGTSKEPSPDERLTAEEAKTNALKTGADLFG